MLWVMPLFGLLLIAYLALTLLPVKLGHVLVRGVLISGGEFAATGNHILIMVGIFLLFVELLKASNATHRMTVAKHVLSTLVFVAFVVLFIVRPACGNATFAILGCLSMVDVLAGWTITYRAGLRDFAVS